MADPFVWVAVALVVYTAVVALNRGVSLGYDAELRLWSLKSPAASFLPGSVAGAGGIHFVAAFLVLTVYLTIARSLDSRQAVYCVIVASFLVVVDALFAVASGVGIGSDLSVAYGLWALMSAATMFSAERFNRPKELLSAMSLSGCLAALLIAGRPVVIVVFLAALLVIFLAFVGFMFRELRVLGIFRTLLLLLVTMSVAAGLFQWYSGDWQSLLPVWESDAVTTLGRFALEGWEENPWTGTGVGSFPLYVRLHALAEDWSVIGPLPDYAACGWRLALAERGMIGALALAVSFGALGFAWFRNVRERGLDRFAAAVPLLPVALVAVTVIMVFDGSGLHPAAIVAFCTLAGFSVNGGQ